MTPAGGRPIAAPAVPAPGQWPYDLRLVYDATGAPRLSVIPRAGTAGGAPAAWLRIAVMLAWLGTLVLAPAWAARVCWRWQVRSPRLGPRAAALVLPIAAGHLPLVALAIAMGNDMTRWSPPPHCGTPQAAVILCWAAPLGTASLAWLIALAMHWRFGGRPPGAPAPSADGPPR